MDHPLFLFPIAKGKQGGREIHRPLASFNGNINLISYIIFKVLQHMRAKYDVLLELKFMNKSCLLWLGLSTRHGIHIFLCIYTVSQKRSINISKFNFVTYL
jgi:hypothetical protein